MKNNKKTPLFKGNVKLEALAKLKSKGIETITEVLILFFIAEADEAALATGSEPPTLASVTRGLRIPFSTASRVIYGLSQSGFLKYTNHKTDRRKKLLTVDLAKLEA